MVDSDDGDHIVVVAPFAGAAAVDLGFVMIEIGDMFHEHFWRTRWYSIKEVRSATDVLKGWYCDVARPASVMDGTLISEDLYLDLWVSADLHTIQRLDEDEFEASDLAIRHLNDMRHAIAALNELEGLARESFASVSEDDGWKTPVARHRWKCQRGVDHPGYGAVLPHIHRFGLRQPFAWRWVQPATPRPGN